MANKTISFNIGSTPMATFDTNVAIGLGWRNIIPDPNNANQTIANPESSSLFFRRKVLDLAQSGYLVGLLNPAFDAARVTANNNSIILT